MSNTKIYSVWLGMRKRCFNKNASSYKNYGGRGITVCPRWLKFENFIKDMGSVVLDGYTLERLDNNGNYEPSNCRWATYAHQNINKRNSLPDYERERRKKLVTGLRRCDCGSKTKNKDRTCDICRFYMEN